jgi:antitoxin (DNA-binding transcriptional repressor) of toxin-antitoxin stability system
MHQTINAKTLRERMAEVLERARRGERFVVLYRSRPVCQIGPLEEPALRPREYEKDPLYGAAAVGESRDGKTSEDHDEFLYGRGTA